MRVGMLGNVLWSSSNAQCLTPAPFTTLSISRLLQLAGIGSKPRSFKATVAEMYSATPMLGHCAPSSTLSGIRTVARSPNIPASNMAWLLGFGLLVLLVSVAVILCLLSGWRERKAEAKAKAKGDREADLNEEAAGEHPIVFRQSWCPGVDRSEFTERHGRDGATISEAVVDPVQLASDVATCGDLYSPPLPSPPPAVITRSMPPTVRMHGNKPVSSVPENAPSADWNRASQNEGCVHERRRALDGGVSLAGGRLNRSDTVDSSNTESTLPPEYAEYDT